MRLWHYELIPYLPKSQLLAQWRELNSIFTKQDKHILINYIYDYPKNDLFIFSQMVMSEMTKRGYKVNTTNFKNYFINSKDYRYSLWFDYISCKKPFQNHHNKRYLRQCFYNLQEKYDRGQKDFSQEQYDLLKSFFTGRFYGVFKEV